jgi:hypothetical protein
VSRALMLTQPVCSRFRRKVVSQARCALRGQVVRPKARWHYLILCRALRKALAHSAAKSEKRLAIKLGERHNRIIIGIGLGADGRETACAPAWKEGRLYGLGPVPPAFPLKLDRIFDLLIELSIDLAGFEPWLRRRPRDMDVPTQDASRRSLAAPRGANWKAEKMSHRFRPGQSVRFCHASLHRDAAEGSYEIIRQLPQDDGDYQYRIKSAREQHERVAKERELERA